MADRSELEIPSGVLAAMVAHCRAEAPREACGILAGRPAGRVTTIHCLRNELASATRYLADARDLIAAVVAIRQAGEQMLAIFHSHPASPAVPSQVDLRLNGYGPLPQLIVSLVGAAAEVRAWRLGEADFVELAWREIVETESPSR